MFKSLKTLLKSKISITIIHPGAIVDVVKPRTIEIENGPIIKHVAHSNVRFVSETKVENGASSTFYFTEIYRDSRWAYADDSLTSDKNKAMELHLKIAKGLSLKPVKVKEILWQGLPLEQTETWVAMQTT